MEEDILKFLRKKIKGDAGFVEFLDDDIPVFYIDFDCLNHGKIYIKVDPIMYTCGYSANIIAQGILEEAKQFVNNLLFQDEGE